MKLAERAAASGAITTAKPKRRRNGGGGGDKEGGDDGDDEDGDLSRIKGSGSKGRKSSGYDEPRESAFELDRFVADFCHPSVVQAYTAALSGYAGNGPKVRGQPTRPKSYFPPSFPTADAFFGRVYPTR